MAAAVPLEPTVPLDGSNNQGVRAAFLIPNLFFKQKFFIFKNNFCTSFSQTLILFSYFYDCFSSF
jgi:hypothetical protein